MFDGNSIRKFLHISCVQLYTQHRFQRDHHHKPQCLKLMFVEMHSLIDEALYLFRYEGKVNRERAAAHNKAVAILPANAFCICWN